jgi:hypothetical protein
MKGADPLIGPGLLEMISDSGFNEIRMNVVLPTFHEGDGKRMGVLTLHAIREAVIENKLASPDEFESVLNELEIYTRHPSSIMSLPRIFQYSAIKG